jgi:hypothetical protein
VSWASRGAIARAPAIPWESAKRLIAISETPLEALIKLGTSEVVPYESIGHVATPGRSPWEAWITGVIVLLTIVDTLTVLSEQIDTLLVLDGTLDQLVVLSDNRDTAEIVR